MEINQKSVSKAKAVEYIASYYNIPLRRTIAFGDGPNDSEMLDYVAHGVAMKNAGSILKSYSDDITDLVNHEGGVGDYLIKFFDLEL
jgi:hydroxymethylpyrimidine pyrophosphatase-like HAD family hydrolase